MFFRLLLESFLRQRRRKLLAGIAILLGTTAVTAMLALATTIGDRIHQELAVYGANIVITPKAAGLDVKVGGVNIKPATGNAYLKESDLPKLKTIFWGNNINGVSPELQVADQAHLVGDNEPLFDVTVIGLWFDHDFGSGKAGATQLHPWWKLAGKWPSLVADADYWPVAVGAGVAKQLDLKIGSKFLLRRTAQLVGGGFTAAYVTGIVSTGDGTDMEIIVPLPVAQAIADKKDAISRVEVSATTKPEDAFARADPDKLSPAQREIWYCRPYANSIAYQIREIMPDADAQQIRKVEQSEDTVLARISGLMWLISAAALLAAGFAVSAAMATAVLERRGEIGLMRSLGASKGAIALLFYAETGLLAIFAGTLGYLIGSGLAAWLGARIFSGESVAVGQILNPVLLPVVVATALIVAIAGSTPSIRAALRLAPSVVLRADA